MFLKSANFSHEEETINRALGVSDEVLVLCRERIFFCHFANTLQSLELFTDRDLAPKELTTVTGDLKRCLNMISNEKEYEITLLHFLSYHRLAQEAFAHWKIENDSTRSKEDILKFQLVKMLKKLKEVNDEDDKDEEDNGANNDIKDIDSIISRINKVKEAKYNFTAYMNAMGFKMNTHPDVDNILKDIFNTEL